MNNRAHSGRTLALRALPLITAAVALTGASVIPATAASPARPAPKTSVSHPGPAMSTQLAPTAKQVVRDASLPCNTSFVPPAPHGLPMYQYYVNCANYTKTVCPSLTTSDGTVTWLSERVTVGPGEYAWWYYPQTVQSGRYTTVYC